MPQLDPTYFPPQLIWLAVSFALLYFVMARKALPKVAQILEERETRIATDLEQAETLKAESEAALAAYEDALNAARQEAAQFLRDEHVKLLEELNGQRQEAEAEIQAQVAEAETRIAKAQAKAMKGIATVAADSCQAIIDKLIGERPSKAVVSEAVAERINAAGGESA